MHSDQVAHAGGAHSLSVISDPMKKLCRDRSPAQMLSPPQSRPSAGPLNQAVNEASVRQLMQKTLAGGTISEALPTRRAGIFRRVSSAGGGRLSGRTRTGKPFVSKLTRLVISRARGFPHGRTAPWLGRWRSQAGRKLSVSFSRIHHFRGSHGTSRMPRHISGPCSLPCRARAWEPQCCKVPLCLRVRGRTRCARCVWH